MNSVSLDVGDIEWTPSMYDIIEVNILGKEHGLEYDVPERLW
jgi:hypothetical protein